jgi:hypothetical protein
MRSQRPHFGRESAGVGVVGDLGWSADEDSRLSRPKHACWQRHIRPSGLLGDADGRPTRMAERVKQLDSWFKNSEAGKEYKARPYGGHSVQLTIQSDSSAKC